MRRPLEVMVVVYRPGPEFLVLRRSSARHGYWNLVAGGVGWEETVAEAALRELSEETGLRSDEIEELGVLGTYRLDGEPADVRGRFAADVEEVTLAAVAVAAPAAWEPTLDDEHDAYVWCGEDDAVATLAYPEPRAAVREAARRLRAR